MSNKKSISFIPHRNSEWFTNDFLNIFTDASVMKKDNCKQSCIFGAAVRVLNQSKIFIEFPAMFIDNDNIDVLEMMAIQMSIRELNKTDYDPLLNGVKQINVFTDSLNTVTALRLKLQDVNKRLLNVKPFNNIKSSISNKERSMKLGKDILAHVLFLGLPIQLFHVKAHMLRKKEIDVDNFISSFRQENFGFPLSESDSKTLIYYNNVVDYKVRSLNANFKVDYETGKVFQQ